MFILMLYMKIHTCVYTYVCTFICIHAYVCIYSVVFCRSVSNILKYYTFDRDVDLSILFRLFTIIFKIIIGSRIIGDMTLRQTLI